MNPTEIVKLKTDDGLAIHCRIWEPTQYDKEIWIVHGMGDHGGRYLELAERFVDHGFRVILADQRGNGMSEGKRGHAKQGIDTYVADLKQVIEKTETAGCQKFIIGQSMGGLVVSRFLQSQEHAMTAAVLLSPMFRTTNPKPRMKLTLARLVKWVCPGFTLRAGFRTSDLTADDSKKKEYRKDDLKHDLVSATLGLSLFESGERAIEEAQTIDIPVLVMHGDIDTITSPEASQEFAKCSEKIEHKMWQDKRHELHNESDNEPILEYMMNWFEAV